MGVEWGDRNGCRQERVRRSGSAGKSWGPRGGGLWGREGCMQGPVRGGWRRGWVLGRLGLDPFLVTLAKKGDM